MKASKRVEVPL